MRILPSILFKAALGAALILTFCLPATAQRAASSKRRTTSKAATAVGPRVTKIDADGLRALLKPNGKPLMLNFWATWCGPCREEFPDLVKLDKAYKGKIDFMTVSLDDLADIDRAVPKFLREMKAEMPAFLLRTADESAAIGIVSKDWAGNLPFTILFNRAGEVAYMRAGKVDPETIMAAIDKLLSTAPK